jgi:hypothetical protein
VNEEIVATFRWSDETKTFVRIKPLNCAFTHVTLDIYFFFDFQNCRKRIEARHFFCSVAKLLLSATTLLQYYSELLAGPLRGTRFQ